MLRTYTESEMLIYWKRRLGLKASAAVVGEEDMTELDRKLLADIDSWYDDLLANAPVERLPVEDMKDEVSCRYISDNAAQIDLPERGVRLVSVRMHEWACDEVECYSPYSAVARLQRNRLTRATVDEPVVLRRPGRIEVHGLEPPSQAQASATADNGAAMPPSTAVPKIDSLEMVVRPPKGSYILDTTLLRQSQLLIH